ncbi:unnamed protein product [Notodromas monacha]|uniref:Nephrocystin 3-like N-terminal domain-containing protein n=1 Tax=Notodromas monacha TaxID=399045 RepID=A0A7R9BQ38_9CRUS|nr:unnamed protein product [Notodromas monacha]CAG0918259.1 unnamed protein product [Notodromas monacha]
MGNIFSSQNSSTRRKPAGICFSCVRSASDEEGGELEAQNDGSCAHGERKRYSNEMVFKSQISTSSENKPDNKSKGSLDCISSSDSKHYLDASGLQKKISDCSYDRDAQSCLAAEAMKSNVVLPEETQNLLRGRLSPVPVFSHKDISVFVISAADDTSVERNELLKRVLPQLKTHCKMQGCRMIGLNVNKLGEHSNIGHYTHRQLCLRILKNIRECSNLVLILLIRDDPGKLLLPEIISSKDFEAACGALDSRRRKRLQECYFKSGDSYLLLKKEGVGPQDDLITALTGVWEDCDSHQYLKSMFEEVVDIMSGEKGEERCAIKSTICLKIRPVGRSAEEMQGAEMHLKRLTLLDSKIQASVDENNIVQLTVKLKDGMIDPEYSSHVQYLDDVCARTMPILTSIVDCDIMPYTQMDPLPFGIDRWLATELKQGGHILKSLSRLPSFRTEQLKSFKRVIERANGHAVIVHGEPGCGKTTFMVSVINALRRWFPGCGILFRFGAMTPQTQISSNLFRSIAIHLSYFLDESAHEQYRKPASKEVLMGMLKSLPPDFFLIIVVDAIDQVEKVAVDPFDWLPVDNLPSNIKIIVSMDNTSEYLPKIKDILPKSSLFSLENLALNDLMSVAKENMAAQHHYLPNANELEQIRKCLSSVQSLCGVQLLTQLGYTGSLESLPNTVQGLLEKMVQELEESLASNKVFEALLALATMRQGVAAEEFEEFFTEPSQDDSGVPNFDGAWLNIFFSVLPFLHTINVGGVSMYTYTSRHFKNMVLSLGSEPTAKTSLESTLRALKKRLQDTLSVMDGRDTCHAFEEIPFLAFQLGDSMDEYIFGMNWLFEKICKCGVTEVENDLSLVLRRQDNQDDLLLLFSALHLSGHALNVDPAQFFTQIYTRLLPIAASTDFNVKFPSTAVLLARIKEFPMTSFIPLRPCLRSPSLNGEQGGYSSNGRVKMDAKLFAIPSDPGYVISLSSTAGKLAVWNCIKNTCVQRMRDLQEPKILQLLPGKRKAICLCGRELILIDLAEGKMELKLKGIMNQKLPLFALVDEYHLITLARNRMYLNLINMESGDCISTFKVGEDRFLNSLVVSENGKICV